MARWRLMTAHYLRVPGTVWEETSVDRETGRQKRIAHPVPLHLDPKDPSAWTHKPSGGNVLTGGNSWDEGSIVVAWAGKTQDRRDIIFEGDPTYPTEMEPLDEEAKEISDKMWPNFKHPMDEAYAALSPQDQLLVDLQQQMSKAMSHIGSRPEPEVSALKETVNMLAGLMAQNTQLLQKLAERESGRRV